MTCNMRHIICLIHVIETHNNLSHAKCFILWTPPVVIKNLSDELGHFFTFRSLSLSLAKFLTTSDIVSSDCPFPFGMLTIISFFSDFVFSFFSEASNRFIS